MSNNPTPAELDEILEESLASAFLYSKTAGDVQKIKAHTKAAIIAYFTALVPEKKPDLRGIKFGEYRGWNDAIDATLKAFKEVEE